MDPNHGSPSRQPPLDSPPQPPNSPPLPHSPPPQPPQHDQDADLPQSPVDSAESVVSDSETMRTFVIKYDETVISFKRPLHLFYGQVSAPSNNYPQPKRRIVSAPERSDSSDSSLDSSSLDSSAKNVSPAEPSSSP
ncbi:hypothetical protein TSUD_194080 [Trifolium subterraneum]|uniref:Uncharacterized protein n=1 Tax=Trifolium subterraneum TaxID=3900 RepID=A0A2Z6NPI3_TRISU|nr:hypothetical protein TSUD_194080 [Trifolium subterraneum]